jgi:DNA-binding MarR family transcriptional regulator
VCALKRGNAKTEKLHFETIPRQYDSRMIPEVGTDHTDGVSFLLRQLGYHSTALFTEQIAAIKLTLPLAGILRAIAGAPGGSQRALAGYLGLMPSRLVAYLDELEEAGYIERRRNIGDRRQYNLYLTAEGKKLMRKLSGFASQHEDQLTAPLSPDQRQALHELLTMVATHQGLTPHVHPGYRGLDEWLAEAEPAG